MNEDNDSFFLPLGALVDVGYPNLVTEVGNADGVVYHCGVF